MGVTAIIGTGSSITYSGFTYKILSINIDGRSLNFIEANKMDTTTAMEFLGVDLYDPGTVTVEIEGTGTLPTIDGSYATLTVTFSNAAARQVQAAIMEDNTTIPLEDKITGSVTFRCSGAWS